jgi:hypothetical protein
MTALGHEGFMVYNSGSNVDDESSCILALGRQKPRGELRVIIETFPRPHISALTRPQF